jgi:hypothetical protein
MRFEYRVELIDKGNIVDSTAYVNQLNEYGQDGWEIILTEYAERKGKPMVSVLMKRSLPDDDEPEPLILTEDILTS